YRCNHDGLIQQRCNGRNRIRWNISQHGDRCDIEDFSDEMQYIYQKLLPKLKVKGHNVINVADMWWKNKRIPIHIYIVDAMEKAGYELRNTIIWDRRNIVNNIGIFGWPSNYITMGTTFEYILDFWRPPDE
ncbi:MAG: hypothetical protein R6U17_08000, partial [Thermoplasmata archaeon]